MQLAEEARCAYGCTYEKKCEQPVWICWHDGLEAGSRGDGGVGAATRSEIAPLSLFSRRAFYLPLIPLCNN